MSILTHRYDEGARHESATSDAPPWSVCVATLTAATGLIAKTGGFETSHSEQLPIHQLHTASLHTSPRTETTLYIPKYQLSTPGLVNMHLLHDVRMLVRTNLLNATVPSGIWQRLTQLKFRSPPSRRVTIATNHWCRRCCDTTDRGSERRRNGSSSLVPDLASPAVSSVVVHQFTCDGPAEICTSDLS